jgi:sterol 3beta-glucosyltransferase
MQITIIALGSRGDVQPYIALGTGLKKAGHTVRVLASQDFEELVTAYGLGFVDMGGSIEAVAQDMQSLLEQGNFLKILSKMRQAAEQMAYQAAKSGMAACQGSDLIIAGLGGLFVGHALSEKLGLPIIQAFVYPFTPTREFPGVLTPLPQSRLTAWANGLSHRLTQQMMWQTTRSADNKIRAKVLKIAPASFWGPFTSSRQQEQTTLYGYSPEVVPTPKDWGDSIHVTGCWFLEPPAGWEPPSDLVNFLQSGPPPIYIGFGSMSNKMPEETADLVWQALAHSGQRGVVASAVPVSQIDSPPSHLARSGQRGVLSSGWGGLKKDDVPETVFMVGSIPHTWLFPRMAAVVHHGGASTTAAGLWAGVPSIITPFMGDQPFWGQRIYKLGVGPAPIPRKTLTAERLAQAIQEAVTDQNMRQRAADLGSKIQAEDGIARALEIIQRFEKTATA